MHAVPLPNSVSSLTDRLHVLEFHWHGVGLQIPKFALYACVPNPTFTCFVQRHHRQIAIMEFGRYTLPILDPLEDDLDEQANFVAIVSVARGNRFGLYGFPADNQGQNFTLPLDHESVPRIVQYFI
ncbi:hypothetical protein FX988_02273 [Paraglaciecola mesophila]|uniref:Uncharacterized protein n=1 Tax=Paraglaciecola mesophila TaxID=197222 RepID=A0A857JM03_9ALTE|nr:hypothetical protein [Paraglaciecola mesophila]QHJ12031.1 hypothetical protein FX988_02273 [Paraglaciecola mesophila]